MEVKRKKYIEWRQLVREIEFEIQTNGFYGKICMRSNIKTIETGKWQEYITSQTHEDNKRLES